MRLFMAVMAMGLSMAATAALYEDRWAYAALPIDKDEHLAAYEEIVAKMKRGDMNGLVYAGGLEGYFCWPEAKRRRFQKLRALCEANGIEIIPMLWSVGYGTMGWMGAEYLENEPIKGLVYTARGGKAVFESDAIEVKNGGFDEADPMKNQVAGWHMDKPGLVGYVDTNVVHGGRCSIRFEPAKGEAPHRHARISQQVKVRPGRRYRFSCHVKVDDLLPDHGVLMIQAYTKEPNGRFVSAGGKRVDAITSQDGWWRVSCEFQSGASDCVNLWAGAWGAQSGRFWLDDASIEEIGYRRFAVGEEFPMVVKDERDGTVYREGADYRRVAKLQVNGFAALELVKGGAIKEGTRLVIDTFVPSSHGPVAGQVSTCMSNPKLYDLFEKSAAGVMEACAPRKWFLSVDEVRNGNRCPRCQARHTDMAHIFGECVTKMHGIIRRHRPDAVIYAWSDMFDPNHNCHDNYFGCIGTFAGVADLIPKDIVMSCWYRKKREASVKFFTEKGFRIQAGAYYDSDDPQVDAGWMETLNATPGATGWLYATWRKKYAVMEDYAKFMNANSHPLPTATKK